MTTISLVVPAAGCGARTGLDGNKILAPLRNRPLLFWTLQALTAPESTPLFQVQELLIAAQRCEFSLIASLLEAHSDITTKLIEGGYTRQDSVFNAVREASSDFILVHDAARPLASPQLIARVCDAALKHDAAIAALPVSDTVKRAQRQDDATLIIQTLPRAEIFLAQTPQVFRRELLLAAFERAHQDNFAGTDCASLVERLNHKVAVVEGEARNFKVTYRADLQRAEELLAKPLF